MSDELLQDYVLVSLVGFAVLFLLLLCCVLGAAKRGASGEKLRERSKRRRRSELRAHGDHHGVDEMFPSPLGGVTGYLEVLRRVWLKYRYGRVVSRSSSSPAIFKSKMADARKASGSVAFPVTRLLSSPAIVVAYSSEFVRDFSDKSSPRRKRYALILKSVSREARGELETYFSAVLEDILSVRQELKQELVDRSGRLSSLKRLGKKVVPLKQRGVPVTSKTPVQAVCNYKQMQNEVEQGEECTLLDNSQHENWKVLTSEGKEQEVPSVCFVIPAPNIEAKDYMTSLEIQY